MQLQGTLTRRSHQPEMTPPGGVGRRMQTAQQRQHFLLLLRGSPLRPLLQVLLSLRLQEVAGVQAAACCPVQKLLGVGWRKACPL